MGLSNRKYKSEYHVNMTLDEQISALKQLSSNMVAIAEDKQYMELYQKFEHLLSDSIIKDNEGEFEHYQRIVQDMLIEVCKYPVTVQEDFGVK